MSLQTTVSPRKRSSSKTQQNYHPINSTPISDLTKLNDNSSDGKLIDSELSLDLNSSLDTQLSNSNNNSNNNSTTDMKNTNNSNTTKIKQKSTKQKPLSLITDINQNDSNNIITPIQKISSTTPSISIPIPNNNPSKPILMRKPLPSDSKSISMNKTSLKSESNISNNNSLPSSSIPNLKKFAHVVRLISPDQPDEYLKVLNIPIYPDTLKIGRQNTPKTSNKITDGFFDSRVLSRNHAELFIKDNQLFIRDLKSSNGTFINDNKLEPYKDYKISINDKIDLGTTLESQMAHKKITCIIKEFDFISLKNFQNLIEEINNKDYLINKKMELFNNTFDALLFGEIVDDIILGIDDSNKLNLNNDLLDLIKIDNDNNNNKENININNNNLKSNTKFIQGLDLKPSQNSYDVVKKLITAVNNEYIQQQRLKEMNIFLKNYNNSIAGYENNSIFKIYDKILKNEKEINLISTPPISPNSKQIKFNKMEEQLKNSIAELDIIRQHLSTSKLNESKMKNFGIENENLKKILNNSELKINELQKELDELNEKHKSKNNELNDLKLELENLKKDYESKQLEFEKKLKEKDNEIILEKEDKIKIEQLQNKNSNETDSSKNLQNNVKNLLEGISSGVVKYSGIIILSVAFAYYTGTLNVERITELVSR